MTEGRVSIREDVLEEARSIITRERAATHGRAEDTFGRIAAYWSVYLDRPVTGTEVAMMMALLKIARQQGNQAYRDNFVDGAGYLALGAEMAGAS